MSEIPAEFEGKEVQIKYHNHGEMTGKISRATVPYYVVFSTENSETLVPWTSIEHIWYRTKPLQPPKSRNTRQKEKENQDKPKTVHETTVEEAKVVLSDYSQHLDFTQMDGWVKVKPIKYLGSDLFHKILTEVKEAGGEYVSAGKDSHFKL